MREWWELMEERGTRAGHADEAAGRRAGSLGKRLRDDAIVSCDTGTIATWWARQIRVKRGQMYSLSGTLASMANGLPYAIAAQIAYPDRQCVAFVGDGGFSMLMAEFATCVKYKLPVKVVIVKNNTLGHDQVGADGLPRQPGVRLRAAADRLRRVRARLRRRPASRSRIPASAAPCSTRRWRRRARSSSKRSSIRSSRRCRRRSRASRPASSPSRSCKGEPNREQDRADGPLRQGARARCDADHTDLASP